MAVNMISQKQPIFHGRDLRNGRVSLPGQIYLITTVTRQRYPFFRDFHKARILISLLREQQERGYAQTISFVVMPDHLHWLMQLGKSRDLSPVIRGVKALASKRCGCRLWQGGFHDHALRHHEDIQAISRYIVINPVRAGLVTHYNDYPHWDAVWMEQ